MTHHIMFDARFCSGKPHGIARVTHKLLEHLLPKSPHCRFTVLISNDHLKNKLPAQPSLRFIKANAKPYSIAEQWELPRIIRREKPDIFHSASFTMPLFSPAPVIVTIFDLIPVLFPKFFPLRYRIYYRIMVRRFCKRAEKIFTSSDNSRTDLMNLYGVPAEKDKSYTLCRIRQQRTITYQEAKRYAVYHVYGQHHAP
ncbi:MAG: glycosyltransferase [bacterium]|nr:glycosyltransferase [bacterium]